MIVSLTYVPLHTVTRALAYFGPPLATEKGEKACMTGIISMVFMLR